MRRARIETLPVGTRVMWVGYWWTVGESVDGETLLTCERYPAVTSWLPAGDRVSVTLASQEVSP